MKHLLFVYGTLKRGYSNHHCLGDDAILYGPAKVANMQLFEGPGFPYAFPTDDGAVAKGELYEISEEAFARCDRLEGYPHHYNRIRVNATLKGSSDYQDVGMEWTNECWIYVTPKLPARDKCSNNEWKGYNYGKRE